MHSEKTKLIVHLLQDGLLDVSIIETALKAADEQNITLIAYLVQSGILSARTIMDYCAKTFAFPVFDLNQYELAWKHDTPLRPEIIARYRVVPLHREQHALHLGMTDPTDETASTIIGFHTGMHIKPMLIAEDALKHLIQTHFPINKLHSQFEFALARIKLADMPITMAEMTEQHDEPVIELVDNLIQNAIENHASDIHIEPFEENCRIRFRQDGLLQEAATIPLHLSLRITTRLKIMANLDIAERRLPQDGRIQLRQPSKIDIRMSTCPTLFGEKIVLRILNTQHVQMNIDSLGLSAKQQNQFIEQLVKPQGLILVTGPTGSGKSMTLYTALQFLNQIEKNISTVEDPVEIELKGINQVAANPKIGLNFAVALRTFLRQDPDIIMVGEIRDTETATIAMQAAQTGHLVLSTLHTNSAQETITRLKSMQIPDHYLSHTISLIIAQRLVRKLCEHCKKNCAMGCEYCYQGYKGRTGIFECLSVNEKNTPDQTLLEAGFEKVRAGITSMDEVLRVAGN